jgi:hypothetical protein
MTDLPLFMKRLVQNDEPDEAYNWCQSNEERLLVAVEDDDTDAARAYAREVLQGYSVTDIEVNGDTVVVHAGPYTGYHVVRRDTHGDSWPTEHGTYTHDPTGVQFDASCPTPGRLETAVTEATRGESRGDAAKATYQRTRL